MEERLLSDEELLAIIKKNSGGGGGTSDYTQLSNLPQINSVELTGNKSLSDLGIASEESLSAVLDDLADEFDATATYAVGDFVIKDGVLYKCTTAHTGAWDANDFTATTISDEIMDVSDAVDAILDGTEIDSFADVENALANTVKDVKVDGQSCVDANGNAIVQITIPTEYEYTVSKVDNLTLKVTTKQNGAVTDETNYTLTGWSAPVDIDGHIELNYSDGLWVVKTLKESTSYPSGQTWSWLYMQTPNVPALTFEEAENHIGLSAAYADLKTNKQDKLTFDDVPTANSDNPVKSGGVKSAIDAAVSSAYHHAGTKTCVELVAGLLVAANEGNVYNMTDSGTTTADFIEGAGQPIKEGDNVGIAKVSDGVYKFDLLSGFVDTTNFVQKSQTAGLLKNDGTVNDEIEGDVSTLKSGLTNLDNEVNGDATAYPYADVITVSDAVPANLADCSVKLEPVQDLHGYDKPWVGGAGVNLMPQCVAGTYTSTNCTAVVSADGTITISGTSGGSSENIIIDIDGEQTMPNQTIYAHMFNSTVNGGVSINFDKPDGGSSGVYSEINSVNKISKFSSGIQGMTVGRLRIWVAANRTISGTLRPMLCTNGNVIPWQPYTNICPISGHTEAVVTVADDDTDPTVTNTYTIALGDTIYGGTVDFKTGVMVVTKRLEHITNVARTSDHAFYVTSTVSEASQKTIDKIICDKLPTGEISEQDCVFTNQYGALRFNTTNAFASVSDFMDYMGGTFDVCFTLRESEQATIQLTPTQIRLLQGTNTLYASTGDISVTVNGVSGSIGAVQEQVNATDAVLAELAEQLPTAPTTDGAYVLTVTVADGVPTYSWESAT